MIDDHSEPGSDPLAGRDPHPREQIDLWPLHDARQELLEEIVSQPGPGNTAAPSARRFLVPVGIAAAVALLAGGGWLVVSGDDDGADDRVVASTDAKASAGASSDPAADDTDVTEATDTTTEAPTDEPSEPAEPAWIPVSELEKGDVLGLKQCRQFARGIVVRRDSDRPAKPRAWTYVVLSDGKDGKVRWVRAVPGGKGRFIGVDKDCTVVSVGKLSELRVTMHK
jgi:hypothetical protein